MMGAVFILIIFAATYVFTTEPLNLWSNTTSQRMERLTEVEPPSEVAVENSRELSEEATTGPGGGASLLTEGQQNALQFIGINPNSLPTNITEEQEACFNTRLGSARVAEITGGETPTVVEMFVAKDCL